MSGQLEDLLSKLREAIGIALPPETADAASLPSGERAFACIGEAVHTVSLLGLALLAHKTSYVRAVAESAVSVLCDPSLENHARFQGRLFPAHRDIFGQVFPVQYMGKDILPLYMRKYLQVLEDLVQVSRMPAQSRAGKDVEQILADALTFLVNNWAGSLAILRPSSKAPEGPAVELFGGSPGLPEKIRTLSHQIKPGIYLLSESNQPVALYPFVHLEEGRAFLFRMLTSDGAFYRQQGKDGITLLFSTPLLMDLGDVLFRMGAYDRAIHLFRLMENENRDAIIMVSALNHCLNAKTFSARQEFGKAVPEWELALAVRPDLSVLYHEAARDYMSERRYSNAAQVLNRLLERYPVNDEAYVALGDVYSAKGDYGRAQRAYEKAVVINPHHRQAQEKRQQVQGRLEGKPVQEAEKPDALAEEVLVNLTQRVLTRPPEPLLGRESALGELMEILACRDKHNALLVGEAGVGKTALVEELARRLTQEGCPETLQGRSVSSLNLGALISGARYRGQFEERVLEMVRKVREKGHVLLVENLHQLVSTGSSRGASLDSASLLKPALLAGDIQVIGTTDEESFSNILEKDPSFLKHFHLLRLEELGMDQVKQVVQSRIPVYEDFHGVAFPEGLVENSLEMVRLSITGRALPESVLDLMDRAAARVALEAANRRRKDRTVERHDLLRTLSEMSGVAYERLQLLDRRHLAAMERLLGEQVVGQEEAVASVSRLLRTAKLGLDLNPHRPDGVFLFVGPTGVGKTELARSMARLLFGDEEKLIRIDMSEYMERISTSRLIGTAPGYVGYYDQNQLTDQVRKNPYCVVLFDEVEKADPQVLNLFLQIFDAGRLTDGRGRTVHFHHATIIMTSNVGTHLFSRAKVGYAEGVERLVDEEAILKEVRGHFTPEFLNRVDEVVVFKSLTRETLARIVELQLADLRQRLQNQGKRLVLEPAARDLLAREGYSFEYGARNLGRTIRRFISEPMAELALLPGWESAEGIRARCSEGRISLDLLLPERALPVEASLPEPEVEAEKLKE